MMRTTRAAVLLAVLLAPSAARADDAERVMFDFEPEGNIREWARQPQVQTSLVPVGGRPPEGPEAPDGQALRILAPPRTLLLTRSTRVPADWHPYEALDMWVYRQAPIDGDPAAMPDTTFELWVYEADRFARYWRRIDIRHTGWKRLRVPLCWFRQGTGARVPRWDRIDGIGFAFRNQANLVIDRISLRRADRPFGTEPTSADIARVAFPDAPAGAVRLVRSPHVRLVTDCAELDVPALVEHLARVRAAVYEEMPFLDQPNVAPAMVIFAEREGFRRWVPRLAQTLGAQAQPAESDGFTTEGIAGSFWDPEKGTLRPTYTHEYVHALLSRAAHIGNVGEWFHEGAAARMQLRFHPQEDLRRIVAGGLANPNARMPLRQLCAGAKIPDNRYWQAVTVVDLFLRDPAFRAELPELLAGFHKSGTTNIAGMLPLLEPGGGWEALEARWEKHARRWWAAKLY